jgi:SPP1 family predicted phage head-tail adaptor
MALKQYRETFNDGFLEYGHKQTKRTEKGKRIGELFVSAGKLAFKELSARESDFQLAGIMSASLDLKVKTLYPPAFRTINKSKLKVIISTVEYDVIKVDSNNQKSHLYFYLQKVGGGSEREVQTDNE